MRKFPGRLRWMPNDQLNCVGNHPEFGVMYGGFALPTNVPGSIVGGGTKDGNGLSQKYAGEPTASCGRLTCATPLNPGAYNPPPIPLVKLSLPSGLVTAKFERNSVFCSPNSQFELIGEYASPSRG